MKAGERIRQPLKGGDGTQVQAPQNRHNPAAQHVCPEWDAQPLVHLSEISRTGKAVIPSEAPAQPALPRVTGNLASDPRGHDQTLQHDRAGLASQCLIEKGQDRNAGGGVEELLEIVDAKEHGDGEKPGGHEPDGHGSHDGDGDHLFRPSDFFRQMGGAVQACKRPIGIDQPDDEGFSWVSTPTGAVASRRARSPIPFCFHPVWLTKLANTKRAAA